MLTGQDKQLVVKSNRLIEARGKLSLQEQRVILTTISMIKPDDEDFKLYTIPISDFKELIDTDAKSVYNDMKEITKGLLEKVMVIREPDGDLQTSWLSAAKYLDKQGAIRLSFDPQLKPYLLQLKDAFTAYQLENVVKLKSRYSIRIYELLKQYEYIGKRQIEIEELRYLLTIEKEKFKLYGDFKRYVILKAQKELKKSTDIAFSFKEHKKGRKIVSLTFHIEKNKDKQKSDSPNKKPKNSPAPSTADQMVDSNLAKALSLIPAGQIENQKVRNMIEDFLQKEDFDYVKWNILYTNKQKPQKDYAGYLFKSLEENFGQNYRNKMQDELSRLEKIDADGRKLDEEAVKAQEFQVKMKHAEALIALMTEAEKERLRNEAIEKLKAGTLPRLANKEASIQRVMKEIIADQPSLKN